MEDSGPILGLFGFLLSIIILIVYFVLAANVGSLLKNSRIIVAQLDLLLRTHGFSQAERQAAFNTSAARAGPVPDAPAPPPEPLPATSSNPVSDIQTPAKLEERKQTVIDQAKQFRAESISKIGKK